MPIAVYFKVHIENHPIILLYLSVILSLYLNNIVEMTRLV